MCCFKKDQAIWREATAFSPSVSKTENINRILLCYLCLDSFSWPPSFIFCRLSFFARSWNSYSQNKRQIRTPCQSLRVRICDVCVESDILIEFTPLREKNYTPPGSFVYTPRENFYTPAQFFYPLGEKFTPLRNRAAFLAMEVSFILELSFFQKWC